MKADQNLIDRIRSFNRYYTALLGVLDRYLHQSHHSLIEARLFFEIQQHQPISASQIMEAIEIDKGYLSKMLKQFEKKGLIRKQPSTEDARITHLYLTNEGHAVLDSLNVAANGQIATLLEKLSSAEQQKVVDHMEAIERLLCQK